MKKLIAILFIAVFMVSYCYAGELYNSMGPADDTDTTPINAAPPLASTVYTVNEVIAGESNGMKGLSKITYGGEDYLSVGWIFSPDYGSYAGYLLDTVLYDGNWITMVEAKGASDPIIFKLTW